MVEVLTGGFASDVIRGQVVNLLRSIGTGLVSSAGVAGGIVVGMLVPGNIFEEGFGCHRSQLTCTVNGQLVDAQTGLPLEGGMVGSGDPNDPDNRGKRDVDKVNGPKFGNLKDHAHRHALSGQSTNSYYNSAVRHTQTGRAFQVRHNGTTKINYVARTGKNSFTFTSTSRGGGRIYTHMYGL